MENLSQESLPQHIAIIMDGNRRWAKERGLPVVAGHKKVVDQVIEELIEAAAELGIPYITFWAWSSENWKRPQAEVKAIMQLFRWGLKRKMKRFIERGARLKVIGNWQALDKDIVSGIEQALETSKANDKITVTFAVNYGGRDEIVRAVDKMMEEILQRSGATHKARSAQDDKVSLKSLQTLSSKVIKEGLDIYLDTAGMPDPDLIVRPGREQRLSGFMLWQSEYAELMFPDVNMPDFGKEELLKVLAEYQKKHRRFGV